MVLGRPWVAMEFRDLFLTMACMSYECHCSVKPPNVSKLYVWNLKTRGSYMTRAAHVSPTAVGEALQTYRENPHHWQQQAPPPIPLKNTNPHKKAQANICMRKKKKKTTKNWEHESDKAYMQRRYKVSYSELWLWMDGAKQMSLLNYATLQVKAQVTHRYCNAMR